MMPAASPITCCWTAGSDVDGTMVTSSSSYRAFRRSSSATQFASGSQHLDAHEAVGTRLADDAVDAIARQAQPIGDFLLGQSADIVVPGDAGLNLGLRCVLLDFDFAWDSNHRLVSLSFRLAQSKTGFRVRMDRRTASSTEASSRSKG